MIGTLLICASLIAVDGDTIKCNGKNMRDMGDGAPFVSGYDTPEIGSHAHCAAENTLGEQAKARMVQLLATPGVTVTDSGRVDKTQSHRPLVWVRLPTGESIGHVMIAEGLARVWTPNREADWCP